MKALTQTDFNFPGQKSVDHGKAVSYTHLDVYKRQVYVQITLRMLISLIKVHGEHLIKENL